MAFYRSGGGGGSERVPITTIVLNKNEYGGANQYTFDKAYDRVLICVFIQRSAGSGLDASQVLTQTLASGTSFTAYDNGVYNNRRWMTFVCDNVQVGDTVQMANPSSGLNSTYTIYEI